MYICITVTVISPVSSFIVLVPFFIVPIWTVSIAIPIAISVLVHLSTAKLRKTMLVLLLHTYTRVFVRFLPLKVILNTIHRANDAS